MGDERFIRPFRRHHGWKTKRGMRLFVAERGAARFQVPTNWVVRSTEDCLRFYDRQPPDDECSIGFSCLRLPPIELPIGMLLDQIVPQEELDVLATRSDADAGGPGLDLAWREARYRDPSGSEALSRTCLARRGTIAVLLTFDLWFRDVERVGWVWDEVLDTLELGRFVLDPTVGDVDGN